MESFFTVAVVSAMSWADKFKLNMQESSASIAVFLMKYM